MLICSSILIICPACQSQTTTDGSTLVPNKKLKDAARLIEIGKIDAENLKEHKRLVDTLNNRITWLQGIIKDMVIRDTANAKIIQSYQAEVNNLVQQRDMAMAETKKQNKYFRRQKRKTVFIAVAGPALTAAAFIYFKH